MGPGGSLEAAFALRGDVPAGTYHVVCDAIITSSVDVRFQLIWRRNALDTTLAEWTQQWEPLSGNRYDAQAYEIAVQGPAIDFQSGDQFVWRFEGISGPPSTQAFIPNADGEVTHGRIPHITLPR